MRRESKAVNTRVELIDIGMVGDDADKAPISCANCAAICCRSEVLLLTETGVPARFIDTDAWGAEAMLRLADGWCAALDRNTMLCTIYANRPLICREFEMGASDCIAERASLDTIYQLAENC